MPLRLRTALHCTRLDSTHPRATKLTLCLPNSVAAAIHPSLRLPTIHPPLVLTGRRARDAPSPQPARHGLLLSRPCSAPAVLGSVMVPCDIGEGCLFPFSPPAQEQEQEQEHPGSRRARCTLRPSATCDAWAPRRRPTDRLGPAQTRYCLPVYYQLRGTYYTLQCRVGVEAGRIESITLSATSTGTLHFAVVLLCFLFPFTSLFWFC
jgi:hypothetical protein